MWKEEINKRFNLALNVILEFVVITSVSVIIFIMLLFGFRMLWLLYNETQVGKVWVASHFYYAELIVWILSSDIINLTIFLFSSYILTSLPLIFCSRIIFAYRFLYDSKNALYRFILCGGPLIYFASKPISNDLEIELVEAAALLVLPAVAITSSMLRMVKTIIPEPSELFSALRKWNHNRQFPSSSLNNQ